MPDVKDIMIDSFGLYYPSMNAEAIDYRDLGRWELLVTLNDGNRVLYDEAEHSIRFLRPHDDDISELDYRNEFSMRLRRMLNYKHVSQGELAEFTGISQPTISSYINRRATPSAYNIDKIARALQCSVDDLTYIK